MEQQRRSRSVRTAVGSEKWQHESCLQYSLSLLHLHVNLKMNTTISGKKIIKASRILIGIMLACRLSWGYHFEFSDPRVWIPLISLDAFRFSVHTNLLGSEGDTKVITHQRDDITLIRR